MTGSLQDTTPTTEDGPLAFKRRKIDRACDSCRRKKTKCDGPKMSDGICTNCIQAQKTCTYVYVPLHFFLACISFTGRRLSAIGSPLDLVVHPKRQSHLVLHRTVSDRVFQVYHRYGRSIGETRIIITQGEPLLNSCRSSALAL